VAPATTDGEEKKEKGGDLTPKIGGGGKGTPPELLPRPNAGIEGKTTIIEGGKNCYYFLFLLRGEREDRRQLSAFKDFCHEHRG